MNLPALKFTISIHSTTRVETTCTITDVTTYTQFQSTPPRGWRHLRAPGLKMTIIYFNPLHHEGGDPDWSLVERPEYISIHSTTRVETVRAEGETILTPISIHSTTRVETTSYRLLLMRYLFQSTPPRGWRHRPGPDAGGVCLISIHSTTRVETAILHNNHYYSSTHFHKQIISHPLKSRPTIPLHSQIRSHCANFPVRISP